MTDDSGFTLDVEPGTYLVTVSADGKSSYVKTINVIARGSTAQNRYINIFTDF